MNTRKYLIILFILVTSLLFTNLVNAKEVTLEEIKESFNNSSIVNSYKDLGFEMEAFTDEAEPNILTISLNTEEGNTIVSYELNDNILSYNHLTDANVLTAYFLTDTIGKLHGYEYGELLSNFNMAEEEIDNYTVENEGFQLTEKDGYYSFKLDITKKVPLVDESKLYLKPSDFDSIKDMIDKKQYGNEMGKKGKFIYNIDLYEDKSSIYIGEENTLTEGAYKSMLSALEAMYGEPVVNYFKKIYPELDNGLYAYEGITIETEPSIDPEEESIYTGTQVILVEIDNEYIYDEILRDEFIGETIDRGNKNITLDFTKNKSYKLGFFDNVSSSDAAFLFKYILEPAFMETNKELEEDTVYYNIVNDKIVVGDKDNSIFKIVVYDDYLEILPTNNNISKTTKTAIHNNVKAKEYEEGKSQEHYRYGKYNVTTKVIYGKEINYTVLKGDNQTFYKEGNDLLTFRFDIEYSKFLKEGKVYIDGNLVDSSNYTTKEGSTIITFNKDYVKKLSASRHTLKVTVADGQATTEFTILSNPKTGDNILLFVLILVACATCLIGMVIYMKKRTK